MGTLGKFEGWSDQKLAEELYAKSHEGGCSDELGDTEGFGWYGLIQRGRKWYLVNEDSQGFFNLFYEFTKSIEAKKAWDGLLEEYSRFMGEDIDDVDPEHDDSLRADQESEAYEMMQMQDEMMRHELEV
jgi:hypothetical protein